MPFFNFPINTSLGKMIPLVNLMPFLVIWSLVWTGLALWHAGRRNEKWWFILFLVVHTAGIGEILYLAFVVKLFSSGKTSNPKTK